MSVPLTIALVAGAAATAMFAAGYVRGTIKAVHNHRTNTPSELVDEEASYGWVIALAVIAATVVIALMGVSPAFLYLGPFLAIATAAVNGFAFFYDRAG